MKLTEIEITRLVQAVEEWSIEKELDIQEPSKQFMKFIEESGELSESILKEDADSIIDAFGDVLVTLIILNQQLNAQRVINYDLSECLAAAYNEIKNRKGQLVDGTFIKESDLT